jgi:hypothetical protein
VVRACMALRADPFTQADPIRVCFPTFLCPSAVDADAVCRLLGALPNAVAGRRGLAEVNAKLLEALCEGGHGQFIWKVEWGCVR